jgi:formylglycine-generating enzyme required for sulfatase activity
MKATIKQVLQTLNERFGASIFSDSGQFKSALAEVPIEAYAKQVKNLLIRAVCDMQAYSRLKSGLLLGNPAAVDYLVIKMSSEHLIDTHASRTVIECIAELLVDTLPPIHQPELNVDIDMVFVQGGTFMMGATGELEVTLGDFYIGKYLVTKKQWYAVMGCSKPLTEKQTDDLSLPHYDYNYDHSIQKFIKKLNSMTGKQYRLPTAAEWEYAARGGADSRGFKYAGSNNIDEVAWYEDNSGDKTHHVPNELGIYDMGGDTLEWVIFEDMTNPTGSAGRYQFSHRGDGFPGFHGQPSAGIRLVLSGLRPPRQSLERHGFPAIHQPESHELLQTSIIPPPIEPQTSQATSSSDFCDTNVDIEMVFVQSGTFMMGGTSEQGDEWRDNEKPVHEVALTDFYIGKYPVTQKQWVAVMGSNPSKFTGDLSRPVEKVNWYDTQAFIKNLNSMTGKQYRLPTEAEWEYAARGGAGSRGFKYAGSNNIDVVAWYDGNSGGETYPVGFNVPNELGIYDMSGNVWEWVNDWYGRYTKGATTNPTGPAIGPMTKGDCGSVVVRGGSWSRDARNCRVSRRNRSAPGHRYINLGFRLALSP